MRKTTAALSFAAMLLVISGCRNKATESATVSSSSPNAVAGQSNLTAEELGELGAKIKKHPKDAQAILSAKGLNEQSFEQAVRKVAESPEQSKRYAAAYKKAS